MLSPFVYGFILLITFPQDLFACGQAMMRRRSIEERWLSSGMDDLFIIFLSTFFIAGFLGVLFRLSKNWQEKGLDKKLSYRLFYCITGLLLAMFAFTVSLFLWDWIVELELIRLFIIGLFFIKEDTGRLMPQLFLILLLMLTLLSCKASSIVREQNWNIWLKAYYLDGVKGLYLFAFVIGLYLITILAGGSL